MPALRTFAVARDTKRRLLGGSSSASPPDIEAQALVGGVVTPTGSNLVPWPLPQESCSFCTRGRIFSVLAFFASCVVFSSSLYRDWTLQMGDAKLNADTALLREQLHELNGKMGHGGAAESCIDRWEHKYPEVMMAHSIPHLP